MTYFQDTTVPMFNSSAIILFQARKAIYKKADIAISVVLNIYLARGKFVVDKTATDFLCILCSTEHCN